MLFRSEGSGRTGGGFFAVVDFGEAAVGVGVDVAENLLGEVEDHVRKTSAEARDGEAGNGVLNVAANVTQGVEDRQAALGAVDGDAHHNAVRQLAGRDGPVGEGELGELVVIVAIARGESQGGDGDQEAAEDLGTKRLAEGTTILQR